MPHNAKVVKFSKPSPKAKPRFKIPGVVEESTIKNFI